MSTFKIICTAGHRVFTIEVDADTIEQAQQKVRQMAAEQGVGKINITATIQVR